MTITVRDASGTPLAGVHVEVGFFGCANLCIDYPESGLTGTTDPAGQVTLDPRVGGCAGCTIQVTADGLVIRTFSRVISPDWDGTTADGRVNAADIAWFNSVYGSGIYNVCADYNMDGSVSLSDVVYLSGAQGATNSYRCYPYPVVGACCDLYGACTMTIQADCQPPAVWHGEWFACVPDPCPVPPLGACCDATGGCTLTIEINCPSPAVWHPEWVSCAPNPCPPVGACCDAGGGCEPTIQGNCLPPAEWHEEWVTCDPNPCPIPPVGACCDPDRQCALTFQVDCPSPSVWHGEWTACDPNPCLAGPCSDFEDGTLQGWTKFQPFYGELLNRPTGGHPGGYMFCGDTYSGGILQALAPGDFTGDLSGYAGIRWDEILLWCDPPPNGRTFPILVSVIGPDTSAFREAGALPGPMEQWTTRFVPFVSTAWERHSGSASFEYVLRHVVQLRINMDTNRMCYEECGIDNPCLIVDPTAGVPNPLPSGADAHIALEAAPNPFQDQTEVRLVLDSDRAEVLVEVFDVSGRLVRGLHAGPLGAGKHSFTWDGKDQAGRQTPAGIYLVRVESGAEEAVGRLVKTQ
jgi:hypothetical protein